MPLSIQELLAQGKLEAALATLLQATQNAGDAELRRQALALSGQFAQLKKQHLGGLLEARDYQLHWNRIAAAAAELADQQIVQSQPKRNRKRALAWVAAAIGVLAGITGFSGYTLRDLWPEPSPSTTQQPVAEPVQADTLPLLPPSAPPPATKSDQPAPGKNAVHIEVKDQGKVGNIITGDSNKIDIKQDF